MTYYSLKTIIDSLPKKKNSKSSLWVKILVRRISFFVTWIFINLGFSPWLVSVLSVFVALAGSIFISLNSDIYRLIGVLLIQFWLVLDCVDGNIARVLKKSSVFGEFIDALSGYYVTGFVFIAVGIAAFYTDSYISCPYIYIIMGGVTSIAGLLSRIIHQKYTYAIMIQNGDQKIPETEVENKRSIQYLRSRFDKELGISGLFMPALIVSYIFDRYDILTIFYFLFQLGGLAAVTAYYSAKAKK